MRLRKLSAFRFGDGGCLLFGVHGLDRAFKYFSRSGCSFHRLSSAGSNHWNSSFFLFLKPVRRRVQGLETALCVEASSSVGRGFFRFAQKPPSGGCAGKCFRCSSRTSLKVDISLYDISEHRFPMVGNGLARGSRLAAPALPSTASAVSWLIG